MPRAVLSRVVRGVKTGPVTPRESEHGRGGRITSIRRIEPISQGCEAHRKGLQLKSLILAQIERWRHG